MAGAYDGLKPRTPTPWQRRAAPWLVALGVALLLLYAVREVLLPFIAGLALAYLLDPLADRLTRLGLGRLGATLLILGLVLLGFALALILVVPLLGHQLVAFIADLPAIAGRLQAIVVERGGPLLARLGIEVPDLQGSLYDVVGQGAAWAGAFLRQIWSGGQALAQVLSLLVVTPVVAFYLLNDWDRIVATVDSWVPLRHRATLRGLAREADTMLQGFVRGQGLVCLFLGTWYAVGLGLVGLRFGVLIGVMTGILSFIPYVGSLTGFVLSTAIATVQFWPEPYKIGIVLAVFFSGQFIEGNILAPKLVGESVGLHPVWVMFALFAFGAVFGFVGLLLAVPLAAIIGVLARFALRRYLASPLYSGLPGSQPDA